jgi:phage terminase large subunit-like protein
VSSFNYPALEGKLFAMEWFNAADSAGVYWDEQTLNDVLVGCCEDRETHPSPLHMSSEWQIPQIEEGSHPREVLRWQWTAEEDILLSSLAKHYSQDWSKIVEFFPNKSVSNVKKRYLNKHSPEIRKSNWTSQEDQVILSLYTEQNCSWIQIAEHLIGRQPDAIKNRFYGTLRKKLPESEQARLARRPKRTRPAVQKDEVVESPPVMTFNEDDLRNMTADEKLQRIEELCSKVNSLESSLELAKMQITRLKETLRSEGKYCP